MTALLLLVLALSMPFATMAFPPPHTVDTNLHRDFSFQHANPSGLTASGGFQAAGRFDVNVALPDLSRFRHGLGAGLSGGHHRRRHY